MIKSVNELRKSDMQMLKIVKNYMKKASIFVSTKKDNGNKG